MSQHNLLKGVAYKSFLKTHRSLIETLFKLNNVGSGIQNWNIEKYVARLLSWRLSNKFENYRKIRGLFRSFRAGSSFREKYRFTEHQYHW